MKWSKRYFFDVIAVQVLLICVDTTMSTNTKKNKKKNNYESVPTNAGRRWTFVSEV